MNLRFYSSERLCSPSRGKYNIICLDLFGELMPH